MVNLGEEIILKYLWYYEVSERKEVELSTEGGNESKSCGVSSFRDISSHARFILWKMKQMPSFLLANLSGK